MELNPDDNILLLSELGDQYKGSVVSYNNGIVKLKFDSLEEDFFVDNSINIMFNETGRYNFKKITEDSEGVFKFNIEPTDVLTNKPLATSLVWQYLGYNPPTCNCPTCINSQISRLESALQNVPPDNQMANLLALHINEFLLPSLRRLYSSQTNIFRSFLSLLGMDVSSDEELNELLNTTFNQQGDTRIKSSNALIENVKKLIRPYDANTHKHKSCCLCLEDISNEEDKRLIVTCPKCEQVFCAGNDDDKCGGFFKHMGEDHRCPCCRTKIKEWINEVESKKIEK